MFLKYRNDLFLRRYFVFFAGSMLVAVINYLYHPVMGRLLSPADFGEVQVFLSLILQTGVIFGTFSIVAINITANVENETERNTLLYALQRICFAIITSLSVLMVVFMKDLNKFFNLDSDYLLYILILSLPFSLLYTFRNAFVQGKSNFTQVSTGQIVGASSKLLISGALVLLGLGVFGAVLGIVISTAVALLYLIWLTHSNFPFWQSKTLNVIFLHKSIKPEIIFGMLVFASSMLVTLLYTSDVLIVKRFFSAEEAGLYSGISAIGKIVFFVIAPVSAILVSSIKIKQTFIENWYALKKALLITGVIGSATLFTFYFFSALITKTMLGGAYSTFAHYLPTVGLVMFLAGLMNVLILYFLALRRYFLIILSLGGVAGLVWVFYIGHETIEIILRNLIIGLLLIIGILITVYVKDYFSYHSSLQ
jgi:O-antigen/teichoic acid export membrane protein